MNEALILEKLDTLTEEVKMLRSERERSQQHSEERIPGRESESSGEYIGTALTVRLDSLSENVAELQRQVAGLQTKLPGQSPLAAGTETALPKTMQLLTDMDKNLPEEELALLLHNLMHNLNAVGEGLDLLRAGVELRDDLVQVLQLVHPRIVGFFSDLHEGEFQTEQVGDLLHTILINIHTFSDLLNMIQPFTELAKEATVVLKQSDVLHGVNVWLDGFQQSSGAVRLLGVLIRQFKQIDLNEQQLEALCRSIESIDFSQVRPVGAFAAIRQLKEPQVQEALGFLLMLLKTIGSCVHDCRAGTGAAQQSSKE